VRTIAPREQLPVDASEIVALPVGAVFREFGGRSAHTRWMNTGHRYARHAARTPSQSAYRVEKRTVHQPVPALIVRRAPHHHTLISLFGIGTCSSRSSTIRSAESPSASAAKLSRTR